MGEKILLASGNIHFATIVPNQEILPVFLALMLAAAVAWLFLSNRLYTELRQNYPSLYKALGSPKLFMTESIAVNLRVFRFLFKQADQSLLEPTVTRLCQGLRALFYIYIICLAGILILLFDKMV